ncbi:hypothetical protein [Blastococcus haudaquaticus]|uniref:Uncharacterized protein n=1 Tax=Blastococcus haudaquaticus TaxID=1938745 RepID=A0A286GVF6_9ACTN|nr:hypothetical protein [Blastococcus haudaquaticus]SOD99462.1 hypothetical protein SAMN06272739_2330 [Blastococcus haudaquaticus]
MPDMLAWGSARIPVFASVPSKLDEQQVASKRYIYGRLAEVGLEPRTVGASDRGMYNPLHEVRTLARHCAGGIILGYTQISAKRAYGKTNDLDGMVIETVIREYHAPTPWNQLETGILFGLGLPLFVLKQDRITGGVFDEGASDVLVHPMPMPGKSWDKARPDDLKNPDACIGFDAALLRWQGLVRSQYYRDH